MDVVDVNAHRGEFFRVLQQTKRSQTAVMTVPPGQDAGPAETHRADQIGEGLVLGDEASAAGTDRGVEHGVVETLF